MDHFDEMLQQSQRQPHRLRHLHRALEHIQTHRSAIWCTTPGAIVAAAAAVEARQNVVAEG